MARRAVQTLVAALRRGRRRVSAGRWSSPASVRRPAEIRAIRERLDAGGRRVRVRAGPLAAEILPRSARPTASSPPGRKSSISRRREGDRRFLPDAMPGWADFNGGDMYYGFPDLEGARGQIRP